ncbi:PspC domain-containing protein [Mucilaginibacter conchicola]|uniref:PspC domain-containing protein n=1 Tax=Mucilaginibacter conchicola TaxID=2303333 RepID=A0A372NTK9_9SPHI|nr:PspC domain-containing protein [Mucilaginibacter conchicola]RFZ92623.1 PspC domain-containing protein [Mucilaginibacter conchicola]
MNKTIIININGIVFHIEENAYEILKNYMTDVQRHFMGSADSLEITTDIENRIAEMFNEILLREGKQVVIEQDVIAVVEQMGSVADFESAEDGDAHTATAGFAFPSQPRRLFRDPDDHLVAGVCAGIANYFDFNAVWVRLLLAVLVAFGGTGAILYIILWIVVPKAKTRADRMAMKGQRLNLQGFKTNFEEEMSGLRSNLSNFSDEARPFVYKTRDFAGDFFQHFGTFLGGAGKVIFKAIAVCVLLACFGCIIAVIGTVVAALATGHSGIYHMFPFSLANERINNIFLICAVLMLIIPLLAIILGVLTFVFNTKGIGRATASTLLMCWIVSISVVIYYAVKIASDFKSGASYSKTINVAPTSDNTFHLKLNQTKFLTAEDSARYDIKDFKNGVILDNNEDDLDSPNSSAYLNIERSEVAQPVLVEEFSSRGGDYQDALNNARAITYHFEQTGNVLKFNRRFNKDVNRSWRGQEVRLTLKVPLNTKLVIDDDINSMINGINVYDCKQDNKQENASFANFLMTDNGLQCKIDTLVTPNQVLKTDSVKADTAKK